MASAALVQCTFFGNAATSGGNVSVDCGSNLSVSNCLIALSNDGVGLYEDSSSNADISCTDIFGNTGGDWVGAIADQYGLNGNICLDPLFCEPDEGDFTLREGSPCLPDHNPDCGLIGAHPQGCSQPLALSDDTAGVDDPARGLRSVIPLSNYPNPFNPVTTIRFDLPRNDQVQVRIHDATGALIKVLQAGELDAGPHEIRWRGDDTLGRDAAAGVYFCLLETGRGECTTRRMVLLK